MRLRKILVPTLVAGAVLSPTAALAGSSNGGNNNDGDGIVNTETVDAPDEADDDADDVDSGGSGNGGNNNAGDGIVNS